MKGRYEILAKDNSAEITIYDDIGAGWFGGISADDFAKDLKALGKVDTLNVYINSGGGNVFAGLAIHNTLKRNPAKVVVNVDGLAASIASIVAMTGDEIIMAENAFMMIHDPWSVAAGSADDMRDMADTMDKVRGQLLDTYVKRSSADETVISDMMSAETWLTASEAQEFGLADTVGEPLQIAAYVDKSLLEKFKQVPEMVNQRIEDMDRPRSKAASTMRAYMRNKLTLYR
ncbi:MAG: Clp protease ClpP [Rhodospirillaceae bacterium]|nr:Clp protease ClpP [Rhodospirillaceae bacterium]